MMKKFKSLSICIIAIMLLVAICPIVSLGANTTITFEDTELAQKVAEILGSKVQLNGNTLTISESDLNDTTVLNFYGSQVLSTCKSLKGLENFTNLTRLSLRGGVYTDLTPLTKLTKLEDLEIVNASGVKDFSDLKNVMSVKTLWINDCPISDISGISNLKNLESLAIDGSYDKIININVDDLYEITTIDNLKSESGNVWNSQKVHLRNLNINCTTSETAGSDGNVKIDLPTYLADVLRFHKEHSDIFPSDAGISCVVEPSDTCTLTIDDNDENPSATIVAPFSVLEKGELKIKIGGLGSAMSLTDRPLSDAIINIKYVKQEFKVEKVTKDPETENADKVKVTITVNKELDPNKLPDGWTLGEDGKSISKEFDKNGKEDVLLVDKDGNSITQTVEVTNIKEKNGNEEEFKVVNKTDEDQGNGKVKVTVTVNKELDPNKLPDGWTLGEDGKSIWKVMDKGTSEDITLVAKDGSTLKYTVTAGDKTTAPGTIPQTGIKNTIVVVVAAIAIIGTVVFVRSRKMLK